MIGSLVRKELRQLLPLSLALLALIVWATADSYLLGTVDSPERAARGWLLDPEEAVGMLVFTSLLGVITAYNLLPGEHDQRTIEFLYTLPVRRWVVFLTKFAVGSAVLVTFQAVAYGLDWIEDALGLDSFARRQRQGGVVLLELALACAFSVIALAYGMLISFFRRLGWVLIALVAALLRLAKQLHPQLGILSVQALFDLEYHGSTPLVPWRAWQVHALLAPVMLLLAGFLWLRRQEDFAAVYARLRAGAGLRRVATVVAMVVVAAVSPFLFSPSGGPPAGEDGGGQPPGRGHLRTLETPHFELTYRQGSHKEAQIIFAEAERAYSRVRERLRAPEVPAISADLTEESDEHLGIAGWKRLRLDIRPPKSEALLRHLLYHEVTHVFTYALAAGLSPARKEEARLFFEGLAEYLAHELAPRAEPVRADNRQIAALARSRFGMRVAELFDPERLLARYDEHLLYALGEVWVAALVEGCGATAPAKVLARFASRAGPQSIGGLELWRHTLQAERCDLDRVTGLYERMLARERPAAEQFPVATARFVGEEAGELLFEVRVAAAGGGAWPVAVRVRDNPATPFAHRRLATATARTEAPAAVVLRVPLPPLVGERFEFQVGAARRADGPWFYSRWQSTRLTSR